VQFRSLWRALLRVGNRVVIEGMARETRADGEQVVVVSVRLRRRRSKRGLCGRCGRLAPGHDAGAGRRRWRSLDQGTMRTYIEADAPRVAYPYTGSRRITRLRITTPNATERCHPKPGVIYRDVALEQPIDAQPVVDHVGLRLRS
jgi:transposase